MKLLECRLTSLLHDIDNYGDDQSWQDYIFRKAKEEIHTNFGSDVHNPEVRAAREAIVACNLTEEFSEFAKKLKSGEKARSEFFDTFLEKSKPRCSIQ